MEQLAKTFAYALRDRALREAIKEEALKKFDGDYNILYKNLSKIFVADKVTVEEKLAASYIRILEKNNVLSKHINDFEILKELNKLIASVPKFQISIPIHIEKWNTDEFVPLVACQPVGIDDKLVKEIKAYDSDGNLHILDGQKEPEMPVIVLGISERTDNNGNVIYSGIATETITPFEPPELGWSEDIYPYNRGPQVKEILYGVNVINDCEPWWRGEAEIRLIVKGIKNGNEITIIDGNNTNSRYDGFDDEYGWLYPKKSLFSWGLSQFHKNALLFYWYEEDGVWNGTITITLNYQDENMSFTITLNIYLSDPDDKLGYAMINYADAKRFEYNAYHAKAEGEIKWMTRWINLVQD